MESAPVLVRACVRTTCGCVFQFKLDGNEVGVDLVLIQLFLFSCVNHIVLIRGTQRHSENICSEDNLRSRIFGAFVVKCLACLPLLGIFEPPPPKWYDCPFLTDFYPKMVFSNFRETFFWLEFSKR